MFFAFLTLCLIGVGFLVGSILPLVSILSLLREGPLRRIWGALGGLVGLFIAGYLVVIWLRWGIPSANADLVVGAVFCGGGCFVLCVTTLSRRTVIDVRRLALLERDAFLDPLTGLYNRRYLMRRLDEHVALARRERCPLAVLMIDVDHFKDINDTAGHGVGDQVLREIGRVVATNCRCGEIAVRHGGDELVVLAAGLTADAAKKLAEHLRHEIAMTDVGTGSAITVSIGVSGLADGVEDAAELLARADEALYAAKHAGRNCVCTAGIGSSAEAAA